MTHPEPPTARAILTDCLVFWAVMVPATLAYLALALLWVGWRRVENSFA